MRNRNRPYSFVRAHRRRWGLTQAELARLLGVANAATVSRIERAVRTPTAPVMMSCSILFGVPDAELFASLQESVAAVVADAAKGLYDRLGKILLKKAGLLRARSPDSVLLGTGGLGDDG